jgi:hypothetical protein
VREESRFPTCIRKTPSGYFWASFSVKCGCIVLGTVLAMQVSSVAFLLSQICFCYSSIIQFVVLEYFRVPFDMPRGLSARESFSFFHDESGRFSALRRFLPYYFSQLRQWFFAHCAATSFLYIFINRITRCMLIPFFIRFQIIGCAIIDTSFRFCSTQTRGHMFDVRST